MRAWVTVIGILLAAGAAPAAWAGGAAAGSVDADGPFDRVVGRRDAPRASRADTLWILDADFEDLTGDNAWWLSFDLTSAGARANYWAVDTIRTPLSRPYLGDRTWWCGTYAQDACWRQARGYGNYWECILERDFSDVLAEVGPNYALKLEWDQRYAMEKDYDYGYVDASTDAGATWTTLAWYSNGGLPNTGGVPMDWGGDEGHITLPMTPYAQEDDLRLRFRFVSDQSNSSRDQYDDMRHSYLDGAWQLDNIKWSKRWLGGDLWTTLWLDDCEDGGDPAWVHTDLPERGVAFARYQYPNEIWEVPVRPDCGRPPDGSWVMAAVDPATKRMVDGQNTLISSPLLDVTGADGVVARWTSWLDLPEPCGIDWVRVMASSNSTPDCTLYPESFWPVVGGTWNWTPEGGSWSTRTTPIEPVGEIEGWLRVGWQAYNEVPTGIPEQHLGGVFLDHVRVGIPVGGLEGTPVRLFRDWFEDEIWGADDQAIVHFEGLASVSSVQLVVHSLGLTFPMTETPPGSGDYVAFMPSEFRVPGQEALYYFEAFDTALNSYRCPANAPDECFERSVLPRGGQILIVDKAGCRAPGYDGSYEFETSYYYESALEMLGYTWDRFDVPAMNGGDGAAKDGPDASQFANYGTVFWVGGNQTDDMLTGHDMTALGEWLYRAEECDLALAGSLLGYIDMFDPQLIWLDAYGDAHVSGFGFEADLTVNDVADWEFPTGDMLTYCPLMQRFSFVDGDGPATTTEAMFETPTSLEYPAAVLHRDAAHTYHMTTLGFGLEYVGGDGRGDGTSSRVGIVRAMLESMGVDPEGPGTGVTPGARDGVSLPRPNPFNPTTTLEYGIATGGRVTVRLYDLRGKVVRTLLDADVPAGTSGRLVWDGSDDGGAPCASGVYFCRVEAAGFEATRKLVLLK